MDQINRFAMMIDALAEITAKEQTGIGMTVPSLPVLTDILASAAPLPGEALFLGLAEDSLTVLLNLYDPTPGPLLIVGDPFSGKTSLLKTIARALEIMHPPSRVQSCVITGRQNDWQSFKDSPNLAGIYSFEERGAQDLLNSLVRWSHNNRGESQSVVLFIDNLEEASKLSREAEQNLRWLLLRGPSRRVWPIVTLDSDRVKNMDEWLGFFRTRLFGYIKNTQTAEAVTGATGNALARLIPGVQFSMREGTHWLNFWIPSTD